jgi:hypothetical protein
MNERILSCPIPQNINPLSPNGYLFTIDKLPRLSYFAQSIALPTISLGAAEITSPFSNIPVPGEKIEFASLSVQFMVDENMDNYKAIYNWIAALGFPDNHAQYANYFTQDANASSEYAKNTSDAMMIILGNNNNPIQTVKFFNCWPEDLGSLAFTSNTQDVQYLIGDVSFKYSHYAFV